MYVITENTPGYMPENDDPTCVETLEEAKECLREEVERYLESCAELGGMMIGAAWDNERMQCYVCSNRPHDLGRVFEIHEIPFDQERLQ